MPRVTTVFFTLVAPLWACGPIDQSGASGNPGAFDGGAASSDAGPPAGAGGQGSGGGPATPAASTCDGVMPASIPVPVTVMNAHGSQDICWNATADLAGNLAAESHPASMGAGWKGNWQVWSNSAAPLGGFGEVGGDVSGQPNGFASTNRGDHVLYSPTGNELKRTKLSGSCAAEAFSSATGGTLVLERCGADLKAYRFDANGNQTARANLGPSTTAAGVVDAQDRILIVAGGSAGFAARWFDAGLKPASDSFGIPGGGGTALVVRPLIRGGAATQIDGGWVATIQSGKGSAEAASGWLASHRSYDLQIVRGGKAYALIPRGNASPHNALDLYSAAGERCGTQSFSTDGLSVGPEGTVIGSSGGDGCTHPFWSGLLR